MERRDFIKGTAAACLLLGAIPFSGCTTYRTVASEAVNGKLKVKRGDFMEDKWVVVKSEKTNAPILLSKSENGNYAAVLMLCTHKQCEVKPAGTILACPCHGAEFSFSGKVMKEPAETDLLAYQTSTDENNIYIHL